MCRPRSVSNAQLSRITNLVCRDPTLTASQVAEEMGLKPRLAKFYLKQLRSWGWVPAWTGRDNSGPKPQSAASHASEETDKAQWRRKLGKAEAKWAELMGGRSYA